MNTAEKDKKHSEYVRMCPPVNVNPVKTMPGSPVWCGNNAVDEYWKEKDKNRTKALCTND